MLGVANVGATSGGANGGGRRCGQQRECSGLGKSACSRADGRDRQRRRVGRPHRAGVRLGNPDPRVEQREGDILVALAPGTFLVLTWLVRLVQWWGAARAPARRVMVTAHLAQSPQPGSAGRVTAAAGAASAAGGIDAGPKGYPRATVSGRGRRGPAPTRRLGTVVARADQAASGHGPARVRRQRGRRGRVPGRLWPASLTLRRVPTESDSFRSARPRGCRRRTASRTVVWPAFFSCSSRPAWPAPSPKARGRCSGGGWRPRHRLDDRRPEPWSGIIPPGVLPEQPVGAAPRRPHDHGRDRADRRRPRPAPRGAPWQHRQENGWWGGRDSNPRPRDYESPALTR